MTFTAVSGERVIFQEGTFMYSFECSGTVYAGQFIMPCGDMKVKAANVASGQSAFGVAAYGQTDGNMIGVYGPGNIVRGTVSGTSVTAGTLIQTDSEGSMIPTGTNLDWATSGSAIALESQTTNNGECRMLLVK